MGAGEGGRRLDVRLGRGHDMSISGPPFGGVSELKGGWVFQATR
jgi:hypothetical protein